MNYEKKKQLHAQILGIRKELIFCVFGQQSTRYLCKVFWGGGVSVKIVRALSANLLTASKHLIYTMRINGV